MSKPEMSKPFYINFVVLTKKIKKKTNLLSVLKYFINLPTMRVVFLLITL